jgi:hypothetical protein
MKRLIALGALLFAVSCGAQSEPLRPTGSVGVSIGSGGVSTNTSVGVRNSNVSLGVNL